MRSKLEAETEKIKSRTVKLYCCQTGEYIGKIRADKAPEKNLRANGR